MNDSRSLIRNSARSSERLFCAWNDEDLEHEDRVERRPSTLDAVAVAQRRVQLRPEHFEVHDRRKRLQLVADVAQPLQTLVNIKKSPGCRAIPASAHRPPQ